jgi:hypothetical protein
VEGYLGRESAMKTPQHREGWATDKAIDFLKNQ